MTPISVVISGIGHASALGQGVEKLRRAWLDGTQPEAKTEMVKTAAGEVAVSVLRVPELNVPKLLPPAVERRMSRFAKLCFVTAAEAMADAGIMQPEDPQRTGMVVGSAFSNLELANNYLHRVLIDGPAGASPSMFAASIHNSIAAQLTLSFGIRGPNSTVATVEQSAIGSLRLGYDWIQNGVVDRVVLLLGDEVSEYLRYYFANLETQETPGEGMVALVLEREDLATKVYAHVSEPSLTEAGVAPNIYKAGPDLNSHGHLYGANLMGAAFEMAIAALAVEQKGEPVACVQNSRGLAPQSVIFSAR